MGKMRRPLPEVHGGNPRFTLHNHPRSGKVSRSVSTFINDNLKVDDAEAKLLSGQMQLIWEVISPAAHPAVAHRFVRADSEFVLRQSMAGSCRIFQPAAWLAAKSQQCCRELTCSPVRWASFSKPYSFRPCSAKRGTLPAH